MKLLTPPHSCLDYPRIRIIQQVLICALLLCVYFCLFRSRCIFSVVDITPPPAQPISLRLDNVLPVVNPRHVQIIGPQVCREKREIGRLNKTDSSSSDGGGGGVSGSINMG